MDNVKNDDYFLGKIKQDLQFIIEHMKDVGQKELVKNEVLLDSMLFRMIQISENAGRLSEAYKAMRKSIPWHALYGLRNRVVHDYGNVVLDIVYDTLRNDIPEMLNMIEENSSV